MFKQFFLTVLVGCFLLSCANSMSAAEPVQQKETSFTLWQLPSQTGSQNMSYVIQTNNGKVIVIDGGYAGDAQYLMGFLAPLGNHVHAWFISHPHTDHVDALTAILNKPGTLHIEKIYGSLPTESWVGQHEPGALKTITSLNAACRKYQREVTELTAGQNWELDGLKIEILAVKSPEITPNAVNNSSIVFKVSDHHKSILFTGDLGVQGGQKLLKSSFKDQLQADFVQMAHHGQNGVNEEFYKIVAPRFCLWPTPAWLWNNDIGKGIDSGTWQTLVVRDWMDKLKVEKHYLSAEGLIRINMIDKAK